MTDKVGTKYAQNARFVGRKAVTGPLNDLSLAHLVSDLQNNSSDPLRSGPKQNSSEELRLVQSPKKQQEKVFCISHLV